MPDSLDPPSTSADFDPSIGAQCRAAVLQAFANSRTAPPAAGPGDADAAPAETLAWAQREDQWVRTWALTELAPALTPAQRQAVLRVMLAVADDELRTTRLAALVPHLSGAAQQEAIDTALRGLPAVEDDWDQAQILTPLVPCLSPAQRAQAGQTVRAYPQAAVRAWLLARLAELLPGRERDAAVAEAMGTAQAIDHDHGLAPVLEVLAPYLSATQWAAAFHMVQALAGRDEPVQSLRCLAPHLSAAQLKAALHTVQSFSICEARAEAAAALVPYLSGDLRQTAITVSLAAIAESRHPILRVAALADLAPHLPPEQRQAVLDDALRTVQRLKNGAARSSALFHLAPQLAGPQLDTALRLAQALAPSEARANALALLLPHLPAEQQERVCAEAWHTAQALGDSNARARVLTRLAPFLTPAQLAEALPAAAVTENRGGGAETLAALAPRLVLLPPADLLTLWQTVLPLLAGRTRADLLSDLVALQPVILRLGGEEAIQELAQAILDVGRWWP